MNAQGSRLAAVFLTSTNAVSLFTAALVTEVTRIQVFATSTETVTIYHVASGKSAPDNADRLMKGGTGVLGEAASGGSGITLAAGDSIWAQPSAASRVTVSLYGVTADIAKR